MPSLHDLIDNLRAGRVLVAANQRRTIRSISPGVEAWLISETKDAICFDIGNAEDVPSFKLIPELFRLPYPVSWFEGKARDGLIGILASEVGERRMHVAVFSRLFGCQWQLISVVEPNVDDPNNPTATEVAGFDAEIGDRALNYAADVVGGLLIAILMALGCSNVVRQEHPAPKSVNVRKRAKGKHPVFSHWTLHLPGSSERGADQGGTHSSPRVHLRRGHIRRLQSGKYTWVEAHVVGDKKLGMVTKDYDARKAVGNGL